MTTESTYRRTKSGQWAVMGRAECIRPGRDVQVSKRDGSIKTERIVSIGKPFVRDGAEYVYGYLQERPSSTQRSRRTTSEPCAGCGRMGATEEACDSSGLYGMVCYRCARQPSYELSFG